MSAVVRVKRRINEEPLTAFVLNCKKRKLENGETRENLFETKDEVSTLLKFAGTVEYQDEPVVSQINRLTKEDAKSLASKQRKPLNQTEKMRQEMRDSLHENRFKVVNCYRTLKDTDEENGEKKEITVVDIEKDTMIATGGGGDSTSNDVNNMKTDNNDEEQKPSTSTSSSCNNRNSNSGANLNSSNNNNNSYDNSFSNELPDNYVYDLYLPENDEQPTNFDYMDNYNISVRPFDDLVYEDAYKNDSDSESDSADSNCEGYYKNDYPDSSGDEYHYVLDDDEDIRRAVERCDFEDDDNNERNNLSSDGDEENCNNAFVYSIDSEGIGFEDDLDYCDANRYGEAYARYKAKILKKNSKSHDYDSELSDNDYDSD